MASKNIKITVIDDKVIRFVGSTVPEVCFNSYGYCSQQTRYNIQHLISKERDIRAFVDGALENISDHGYALLRTRGTWLSDDFGSLQTALKLVSLVGNVFHIFKWYGAWKPIFVDLQKSSGRVGSTWDIPLHIDFVNMENPPEIVAFYCVRPDVEPFGYTTLADLRLAAGHLHQDDTNTLESQKVSEGHAYDLLNVGTQLSEFPILDRVSGWTRYTGKLKVDGLSKEFLAAFVRLQHEIERVKIRVNLMQGDILLINQKRLAHGREALSEVQKELEPSQRRLIMQSFLDFR
jgi:alpha-ketoglutarate-dependent taurine dioxygenase